ncbi:IS30 family transposase [Ferrimonas sediminicola]|uniref:IS30 family transposase n=1 Tax=Ferrimonas sediminicola TaxID=2569538 RepID=A0A4U1B7D8_9GAMM|nr:IS30 family transposase [Ferrimonas sediminicola]TKB46494.1 IS30 family transposase [Ferrimonas sediminicola]
MKRMFSEQEREFVFDSWKRGVGFSEIAQQLDTKPGTVFTMLRDTGGIKPPKRRRKATHLTLAEREEIRAGLSAKQSLRAIAKALGRSPSTISREVNRNRGSRHYKAVSADNRAWRKARRPKPCLLDTNLELKELVTEKLTLNWSPEQISGWVKESMPNRDSMHISHETIYKTIYYRSRSALSHLMASHLRRSHSLRQGKQHSRKRQPGRINIIDGVSIRERPKHIDNRKSLGHWEGDLISGSKNTHIATLVDRKSRYTVMLKLKGKDADSVNKALMAYFQALPAQLRKSLTWDRGMELAKHAELTELTGMPVYFCDAQSPWQRGTNENTNSLIRQYFPKKTCLGQHSQQRIDDVAEQLNTRPRKILGFKTPKQVIEMDVALTG